MLRVVADEDKALNDRWRVSGHPHFDGLSTLSNEERDPEQLAVDKEALNGLLNGRSDALTHPKPRVGFKILTSFCHHFAAGYSVRSQSDLICGGFPAMAKQPSERIAEAGAEAPTKSGQAAEKIIKGSADALKRQCRRSDRKPQRLESRC